MAIKFDNHSQLSVMLGLNIALRYCNTWVDVNYEAIHLGNGGSRKDIESSRNGVSKHRKTTRRIANEDDDDEDTMEASRPLMKKKKKV